MADDGKHPDEHTRRLWLVGALFATGGAVQGIASRLRLGDGAWFIPYALTGVLCAMIVAYAFWRRDEFLKRLFVLGVLVGFGELFADAWAVSGVDILVYNPRGPFIWDSPAYMPFGWAIDVVELGSIGYWAWKKWSLLRATLIVTIIGGISLPLSETVAHYAGFWHYRNCTLIGGVTPLFIVVTETLISATMPLLAMWAQRVRPTGLIGLAALESAWMYAVSPVLFSILGRI